MADVNQWQFPRNEASNLLGWRADGRGMKNFDAADLGDVIGVSPRVSWYGARGDGVTNDSAAFASALGDEDVDTIVVPYTAGGFLLNAGLDIPLSKKVVFEEGSRLIFSGAMGHCITVSSADGVQLRNVEIDASAATGTDEIIYIEDSADVVVTVRKIIGAATGRQAIKAVNCPRVKIIGVSGGKIIDSKSSGVSVEGELTSGYEVSHLDFEGTDPGLCVHIADFANNGEVHHCRSLTSGAEIVGEQYSGYNNSIHHCYAFEPEDAGISKSGNFGNVSDNIIERSDFHGIAIFGSGNTVNDNVILDCGQSAPTGEFAGIACYAAWGGLASNNIGRGNIAVNLNGTSMASSVRFSGRAYGQWATATVYADRTFVYYGNNLYVSVGGGTSGAAAPVHTSGTVSDGSVNWLYILTDASGFYPRDNDIECFDNGTSRVSAVVDQGYGWRNVGASSSVDKPSSELRTSIAVEWASGVSVTFGDIRTATVSSGVKRSYISLGTGTTGATRPTHTSGNASDGSITWRYLGVGDQANTIDVSGGLARVSYGLHLLSPSGAARKIHMPNASPEGLVTGSVGDIALRFGGGVGLTVYLKEVGDNTVTGWAPVEMRRSGATGSRPGSLSTGHAGLRYFDTTLGKPVWWSGTGWVDAIGAAA